MSDEAVLIFETEQAIPFTIDNATGIEKGASLQLTDPMTASPATGTSDQFAGIAKNEKIALDGEVHLALYRGGIFKVTLSGTCTAGDPATTSATFNNFQTVINLTDLSGSTIVGTFLETGTTGQTVRMELRPAPSAVGRNTP